MSRRRRAAAPPPTVDDLPADFRARIIDLLGDEAEEMLQALITPATGLRVNTLRATPDGYAQTSPFPLEPLTWPAEGFTVTDPAARPGTHPHHAAGVYYLQDPGAMVVGALPVLARGARVLDLAAAPGGKSTHIGARMAGEGVLVANDVNIGRARELAGNLERCGVRAVVTSASAEILAQRWPGWFDLVLLDAPCSGESMFHKSEAARADWSTEAVAGCARRQEDLLHEALRLTRPGGLILYSTCTFSPDENEQVIARILAEAGTVRPEPLPPVPGAVAGRPDWVRSGVARGIEHSIRLWPHRVAGAGHFVAALRVDGPAPAEERPSRPVSTPGGKPLDEPDGAARRAFEAFLGSAAPSLDLSGGVVRRRGDDLFLVPEEVPPLEGFRTLWPGWWLGTVKPGRFEPSHALAMGMATGVATLSLSFSADSDEVGAFLRGETLRVAGPDGWLRVEVDGYPLGWGKRSRGIIKNHYPRGLRRV